jgi:hypothetical protein
LPAASTADVGRDLNERHVTVAPERGAREADLRLRERDQRAGVRGVPERELAGQQHVRDTGRHAYVAERAVRIAGSSGSVMLSAYRSAWFARRSTFSKSRRALRQAEGAEDARGDGALGVTGGVPPVWRTGQLVSR